MDRDDQSNNSTTSTTWEWRRVKIRRPPEAMSTSPKASSGSLLPWPRSKPMTIVIKYRGGPEGWVEVRARNRVWRRPGTTAIYDLLCEVFGWHVK